MPTNDEKKSDEMLCCCCCWCWCCTAFNFGSHSSAYAACWMEKYSEPRQKINQDLFFLCQIYPPYAYVADSQQKWLNSFGDWYGFCRFCIHCVTYQSNVWISRRNVVYIFAYIVMHQQSATFELAIQISINQFLRSTQSNSKLICPENHRLRANRAIEKQIKSNRFIEGASSWSLIINYHMCHFSLSLFYH